MPYGFLERLQGSYMISGFAFFALAISYLFVSHISEFMRNVMLPSLLVYAIGTGGIGYYHALMFTRNRIKSGDKTAILDDNTIRNVFIAHAVWFLTFIIFNIVVAINDSPGTVQG